MLFSTSIFFLLNGTSLQRRWIYTPCKKNIFIHTHTYTHRRYIKLGRRIYGGMRWKWFWVIFYMEEQQVECLKGKHRFWSCSMFWLMMYVEQITKTMIFNYIEEDMSRELIRLMLGLSLVCALVIWSLNMKKTKHKRKLERIQRVTPKYVGGKLSMAVIWRKL